MIAKGGFLLLYKQYATLFLLLCGFRKNKNSSLESEIVIIAVSRDCDLRTVLQALAGRNGFPASLIPSLLLKNCAPSTSLLS